MEKEKTSYTFLIALKVFMSSFSLVKNICSSFKSLFSISKATWLPLVPIILKSFLLPSIFVSKILFSVSILDFHLSFNSLFPHRTGRSVSTRYVNTYNTSSFPSNLLTITGSSTIILLTYKHTNTHTETQKHINTQTHKHINTKTSK